MAGGTYLDAAELTGLFSRVTGHRIWQLPIPGAGLRLLGSAMDTTVHRVGLSTALTRAAMDYYTQMPNSDDGPVHDELGVAYRDVAESFTDCIASLAEIGRITPAQAGKTASAGQ